MVFLILEKEFEPPLTEQARDGEAERLDPCLSAHGVRWLRSYLSLDRRRMICDFEAADAEAVRSSFRSAGVAFARVWAAEQYEPGGGARGSWTERRQPRAICSWIIGDGRGRAGAADAAPYRAPPTRRSASMRSTIAP